MLKCAIMRARDRETSERGRIRERNREMRRKMQKDVKMKPVREETSSSGNRSSASAGGSKLRKKEIGSKGPRQSGQHLHTCCNCTTGLTLGHGNTEGRKCM